MIEKDLEKLEQGDYEDNESMELLRMLRPWQGDRYTRTDAGNAYLFADFFADRARYMKDRGCWCVYDGRAWRMDPSGLETRALCKALLQLLSLYASTLTDLGTLEMARKQLGVWQSHAGRARIVADAQDVYPMTMDMLDSNPMYLNCQNGTLDLETGILHPHHPGDLQGRVCAADYLPGVRCERWESFVEEVMRKSMGQLSLSQEEDVRNKVRWIQRMLGYALTGDTRLECMFMLYGATTRNGKSTMMETMLRLMGDYGAAIQPETLAARSDMRAAAGPTEDLARLAGVRFVSASEPDRRMRLSASLVKTLTGNDTITARCLYQSSFQYRPQFKLFLNTNHLPSVGDQTLFESGRVHLVPFERHFEPHEQDRSLKQFFAYPLCLSGILNWCLEGLRELRHSGFTLGDPPESARRMLAAYRDECDHVGRFIRERLSPCEGSAVKSNDVYKAYLAWCAENGAEKESSISFARQLRLRYRMGKKRMEGIPTSVVLDCSLHKERSLVAS